MSGFHFTKPLIIKQEKHAQTVTDVNLFPIESRQMKRHVKHLVYNFTVCIYKYLTDPLLAAYIFSNYEF